METRSEASMKALMKTVGMGGVFAVMAKLQSWAYPAYSFETMLFAGLFGYVCATVIETNCYAEAILTRLEKPEKKGG